MPYKDKQKRKEYMRLYYLNNPDKKVLHLQYCKKYREGLKNAKNTLQPA